MKFTYTLRLIVVSILFSGMACTYKQKNKRLEISKAGISSLAQEIKGEYGIRAGYNRIEIYYDTTYGMSAYVVGTRDTGINHFAGKQYGKGQWNNVETVSLQLKENETPGEYVFTLQEGYFQKVPSLVEKAIDAIEYTQQPIDNLIADTIRIRAFKRLGKGASIRYTINVRPKFGKILFQAHFNGNGHFISFNSIQR